MNVPLGQHVIPLTMGGAFFVLDNINWYQEKENKFGCCKNESGNKQVDFIQNVLIRFSQNKLIILSIHILINSMKEKDIVFRLI